jgi:hypothetical protein
MSPLHRKCASALRSCFAVFAAARRSGLWSVPYIIYSRLAALTAGSRGGGQAGLAPGPQVLPNQAAALGLCIGDWGRRRGGASQAQAHPLPGCNAIITHVEQASIQRPRSMCACDGGFYESLPKGPQMPVVEGPPTKMGPAEQHSNRQRALSRTDKLSLSTGPLIQGTQWPVGFARANSGA